MKEVKEIALVHYSGPPILAGVEMVMKQHAELFAGAGYSTHLIVGTGEQWDDNIKVHIIEEMYGRNRKSTHVRRQYEKGVVGRDFEELKETIKRKLISIIQYHEIEVLVVHNVLTMHLNLAINAAVAEIAKEFPSLKILAWCHDASMIEINKGYSAYGHLTGKSFLLEFPWNLISEANELIDYVTIAKHRQEEIGSLLKIPKNHFPIVPNGIDPIEFLDLDPQFASLYKELRLYEADIVIGLPTRAVQKKNIEFLIDLAAAFQSNNIAAKFLITGSANLQRTEAREYYDSLIKRIASKDLLDQVILLSNYKFDNGDAVALDKLKIVNLYQLIDVFVFPSKNEGFGIPILEAALTKTPIFSSSIPALKELASENARYFAPDSDPKELATEIIKVLTNSMEGRFFRKVFNQYTWQKIFTDHILPIVCRYNQ